MLCLEQSNPCQQVTSFDNNVVLVSSATPQELGPYDIICGRHKAAFNNVGNRRLRVTVALSMPRYTAAQTRKDKSIVIKSIAAMVRSNGGRFLQRQNGAWVELDDAMAHDKVGHAMRDMVAKKGSAAERPVLSASVNSVKACASRRRRNVPNSNRQVTGMNSHQEFSQPAEEHPQCEGVEECELDDFSVSEDSCFAFDYNETIAMFQEAQQQPSLHTDESPAVTIKVEDPTSNVDPLPQQDGDNRRPSVDDQMLSWLICESNTLLFPGLETMDVDTAFL